MTTRSYRVEYQTSNRANAARLLSAERTSTEAQARALGARNWPQWLLQRIVPSDLPPNYPTELELEPLNHNYPKKWPRR